MTGCAKSTWLTRSIGPELLAGLILCVLSVGTSVADDALVMPLASQSLLLDVVDINQRLVTVGERGHILYSDDNGGSWIQAQVPVRQMLTAVVFPSAKQGWAVGHDGVIVTTIDGGEHWVLQRDGLTQQRLLDRRKLEQLQSQLQALLKKQPLVTTQSGRESLAVELEDLNFDIEDAQLVLDGQVYSPPLFDVFFSDALHGIALGAFNTLLITDDGGRNWRHMTDLLDNPDELHLNAVTGNGQGKLWIAGEGGVLFRSENNGANWSALESPYPGSWFGIDYAPSSGRLLLFGLRGNIFYSDDAGDSWQRSKVATERSLAGGGFINQRYAVLVGAVGVLLVSDDGGESFHSRNLPNRVNLSAVTCIDGSAVAVGQGGVHLIGCMGASDE